MNLILRRVHNQGHSTCNRAVSNDASKTQEKKSLNGCLQWCQYTMVTTS